jgi:hypothetical protein
MKYIITERQHNLIIESILPASIKRRNSKEMLKPYIDNGIINYPTLCDDFDNPYDFMDNVIDYAVDELLYEIDDNIEEKDYYSDALDFLRKRCRDLFGKELIKDYIFTCIENQ